MEEIKKGYESLKHDLDYWVKREPGRADEWKKHFDWALERAQQYADVLHTDRDTVLAAWEERRDYWFVNYYQECNQPDLTKKGNVVTLDEWVKEGESLFGKDKLDWKFKCPACGHIQSMREFKNAGLDPELAYVNCASRHGLGGKKDCKWTIGGFLIVGGRYVVDHKYVPHLIFCFAEP